MRQLDVCFVGHSFPFSDTLTLFGDMVGNAGVSVWASVRYEIWLLRTLLMFAQVDMRSVNRQPGYRRGDSYSITTTHAKP